MNPNDFDSEQRQNLVDLGSDGWAFVPAPLPPEINYGKLVAPLTDASIAIGNLNGAARRLQNPSMLIRPLLRREALTSSAMEGTITTLGDMILEETGQELQNRDSARETNNYIRAVEFSSRQLEKIPISHRLITQAHKLLLEGLRKERGANKRPGEYKVNQNAVGLKNDTILTARYVPPPPIETGKCMDLLEAYINRRHIESAFRLVDLAIVHYQFESIHPFDDGNGRIGRMLITLMAQQYGLLDLPILHMSMYLEGKKDEYINKLFNVSAKGEWIEWIEFFLHTVNKCADDATETVDKIIDLQLDMRERAKSSNGSPRLLMIIDALFDQLWTTTPEATQLCGVTYPTAQSDLQDLVGLQILKEIQGERPKLYYSPEILSLSNRPQN